MYLQLQWEDFAYTKVLCELRRSTGRRTREVWWAWRADEKKWVEAKKDWLDDAVIRQKGKQAFRVV